MTGYVLKYLRVTDQHSIHPCRTNHTLNTRKREIVLKTFNTMLMAVVALLLCTTSGTAEPTGVTGRTATTSSGCSGSECHGAASTLTTLSVLESVDGKLTTTTNATLTLTLRVANGTKSAGGCNIAVKSTRNGFSRAGQLGTVTDGGLYLPGTELTHISPRAFVDGAAEFRFTWTAPAKAGTYYLQASGNAVNLNGSASGDQWNFLEPIEIVVTEASSVDEVHSPLTSLYPVPAHGTVTIEAATVPGTEVTLMIIDQIGKVVYSWQGLSNTDQLTFVWSGRTTSGDVAPSGVYSVAVLNDRRTMIGRAVIAH